jgi:hypothetical protein
MVKAPRWLTCRYATCDAPATVHHRVDWLRREPSTGGVRLDRDEADYCALHSEQEREAAIDLLRERRIAALPAITRL